MSSVVIDDTHLTNIANSIREKTGTTETYKPSEMASAISGMSGGKYAPRFISFRGKGQNMIEDLTEEIANLDTSNITDMSAMFSGCIKLTSLDLSNFNTSNVTDMSFMFSGKHALPDKMQSGNGKMELTSLDLSSFDTSNVTNMNNMFSYCSYLTSLDLSNFNTSNVTDMVRMFEGCTSLTSLDLSSFDTSNLTSFYMLFAECMYLNEIPLLDGSNVNNVYSMFLRAKKLTTFGGIKNLGKAFTSKSENAIDLNLSDSNSLTHDSLMNVINELYDLNLTYGVANGGTLYRQKITFGSTNLAKLTEDEIVIATAKGWNVV